MSFAEGGDPGLFGLRRNSKSVLSSGKRSSVTSMNSSSSTYIFEKEREFGDLGLHPSQQQLEVETNEEIFMEEIPVPKLPCKSRTTTTTTTTTTKEKKKRPSINEPSGKSLLRHSSDSKLYSSSQLQHHSSKNKMSLSGGRLQTNESFSFTNRNDRSKNYLYGSNAQNEEFATVEPTAAMTTMTTMTTTTRRYSPAVPAGANLCIAQRSGAGGVKAVIAIIESKSPITSSSSSSSCKCPSSPTCPLGGGTVGGGRNIVAPGDDAAGGGISCSSGYCGTTTTTTSSSSSSSGLKKRMSDVFEKENEDDDDIDEEEEEDEEDDHQKNQQMEKQEVVDPPIAEVYALSQWTSDPYYRVVISTSGGIPAVLRSMKAHPLNQDLQVIGCNVLINLSLNSVANQLRILSAGGIDVLFDAMRNFPEVEVVQCGAVDALFGLTSTALLVQSTPPTTSPNATSTTASTSPPSILDHVMKVEDAIELLKRARGGGGNETREISILSGKSWDNAGLLLKSLELYESSTSSSELSSSSTMMKSSSSSISPLISSPPPGRGVGS